MKNHYNKISLLLYIFSISLCPAATIQWGDQAFRQDLTSQGAPINASYSFQIGTFGGFTPVDANVDLWLSHWKPIDGATYNETTMHFSGSSTLSYKPAETAWTNPDATVPLSTFAPGESIYIWVANNFLMDGSTEWGIYSRQGSTDPTLPNWVIPSGPLDQTAFPLNVYTSDVNRVPFGAINPVDHTLDFQTSNFIPPIPEPAAGLLLWWFGLLGMSSRRRPVIRGDRR